MAKEKHPAERNVRLFKEKQYLEVKLTDDEMKAASKQLAESVQRKSAIHDQLAAFKAQKKGEITMCDADINKNTILVGSGKEMRMVDCDIELDFDLGKRRIWRTDDGTMVEERGLTSDEKQLVLNV